MRQAIALLVTGGLVVGGLAGANVIGADPATEATSEATATATVPDPSEEEEGTEEESDGSKESGSPTREGGPQPDRQRFCAVGQRLERAGRRAFAGLDGQNEASRAEVRKAERQFAAQHGQLLGEVQRVAPRPIQSDVRTLVAATFARAGLGGQAPPRQKAQAAEQRVSAFERRNCRSG